LRKRRQLRGQLTANDIVLASERVALSASAAHTIKGMEIKFGI
jgi:hypothetical protein